jgi:hypothetical protein
MGTDDGSEIAIVSPFADDASHPNVGAVHVSFSNTLLP